MVLVNATKKTVVCDRCQFANTALKRMVGLLRKKSLSSGEGLLIDKCYGIHTVGMRFPIDVAFLDKDLHVLRVVRALPPFRSCIVRKAIYVLELPAGELKRANTEVGDQIQFRTADRPELTVAPLASASSS